MTAEENRLSDLDPYKQIEKLVLLDIDDAFICERMLTSLSEEIHNIDFTDNRDHFLGLSAIKRSLGFRFAMSVQRLLQGKVNTRANVLALIKRAKTLIEKQLHSELEARLYEISHSDRATRLYNARNLFMAHTVVHARDGSEKIMITDVMDILFDVTRLVEDMHFAVSNDRLDAHQMYDKYCEVSAKTWQTLLQTFAKTQEVE